MTSFPEALGLAQQQVEGFLSEHFVALSATGASSPRLVEAMAYAVLNGGKRLRPLLVFASAGLFGVANAAALRVAAALECVHCYSLVHDDLPAMDDDVLRRGKPTTHRAFDEATAILAGDGLLTEAFAILADPATSAAPESRIALVAALARAAGAGGMVGGQMLDLAAEGRFSAGAARLSETEIRHLQGLKTGALLGFACEAGCLLAPESTQAERAALARYGARFGLAFQLKDDLLDVEGDSALVGKALRKDEAAGKATLVGVLGVARAREALKQVTTEAGAALDLFGERAGLLRELLAYNAARDV
jgi:farnesyl diphosphate synthase